MSDVMIQTDVGERLTPTEEIVARLVIEGKTNRCIANEMGVSPRTVETHLEHIFDKTRIRDRRKLKDILNG